MREQQEMEARIIAEQEAHLTDQQRMADMF
jgi:hypothetical protein